MAPEPRRLRRSAQGSVLVGLGLVAAIGASAVPARADDPDPWISRDKAFHFDVSAGLAAAGYGVSAGWIVDARWKALAIGGGLALVVGAGKELVDATGIAGGDPSWKDFTWDALGAVAGLALAWGVDLLLGGVDHAHPAFGSPAPAPPPVPIAAPTSVTVRF
jgi:putative lipoprotein